MCKNVIPISRPPRSRHVPHHVVVHHPDRRAHLPRLRRLLLLHLPALLLSLRVLPVHLLLLLQLVETGLRKPRNRLENQRETKAKNIVVGKNEGQPPKCLGNVNERISVRMSKYAYLRDYLRIKIQVASLIVRLEKPPGKSKSSSFSNLNNTLSVIVNLLKGKYTYIFTVK